MPRYRITTPEQVYFRYEIAGLVTRAMAWLLDQFLILVTTALLLLAALWLLVFLRGFAAALFLAAKFLLDFGYYTYFELYRAGQSPGKRWARLRVVAAHGGRLRFADVLIRNLVRWIDNPFLFLVVPGGAVAFLDPYRRRLGDLAADTIVVRDARVALPEAVLKQQSRVNTFQAEPAIRNRVLARVTREERDLILDLMVRRDTMHPDTREELFAQAATLFRRRYALPEDLQYLSDEQTVLNLALVLQAARVGA